MSFIRLELASGAFGTAWFAWNWTRLRHAEATAALREAERILGLRRRRGAMFVHNGLSATRPFER